MSANAHDFVVLPAMHLRGGRALDLAAAIAGEADGADPLAEAERWLDEGAAWIHVVDVDAVIGEGSGHDWPLLERLCRLPLSVQYGGGLRCAEDIDRALDAGVARVLLGRAAIESPQTIAAAIARHGGERFALGIEATGSGEVIPRGWREAGGVQAVALGVQMYHLGVRTAVHTRIDADGSMSGADLEISEQLARLTGLNVIVGGEVRDMDDVVRCYNRAGIGGVLIGKALQNGRIELGRALRETRSKIAFETGLPGWKEAQRSMKARLRYALCAENLAAHLPAGPLRVLDAGGGNGVDALALARLGHRVDLVDSSLAMLADLEEARAGSALAGTVETHAMDIREIDGRFAPGSVDLLLCHNVIQYSDDWDELLSATVSPLAPGALFSLVTRNRAAAVYDIDLDGAGIEELPALLEAAHVRSEVFDAELTLFSLGYLAGWLEDHGFELLADYGVCCLHDHPRLKLPGDDPVLFAKLETLERHLGALSPYKDTARYLHLVARRR